MSAGVVYITEYCNKVQFLRIQVSTPKASDARVICLILTPIVGTIYPPTFSKYLPFLQLHFILKCYFTQLSPTQLQT